MGRINRPQLIVLGLIVLAAFAASVWIAKNTSAHTAMIKDPASGPNSEENYFVRVSTTADAYATVTPPPSGSPSQTEVQAGGYAWAQIELLPIEIESNNPSEIDLFAEARAARKYDVDDPEPWMKTMRRYKVTRDDGSVEWRTDPVEGLISLVASVHVKDVGAYNHYARAKSDAESYERDYSDSWGGRRVGIPRLSIHSHPRPGLPIIESSNQGE